MSMNAFLPVGPIAAREHADALLELAFLVTAADGRLAVEEVAAFRDLMGRVRGGAVTDDEVAALYERFSRALEGSTCADRVRAVAPTLPVEHRESAFRVALALALIDRDASPHEDALIDVLFHSLQIELERAQQLASEVRRALSPPLDSPAPTG
ncbi:MAG TPA: TerB family tellurite resistance protein [Labilithrix sp.]|jgi:tellurite resistance protein|nr:TerB family tellurite resistance protein [Labilithrix sp.]